MDAHQVSPKWWQLYLTFPFVIGLFFLDSSLNLPDTGHELVQLGIVVVELVLVELWLKANASAMSSMDEETYRSTITVIVIPPYGQSNAGSDSGRPALPADSEIKGVLADTFEMDYIDAESYPAASVAQTQEKAQE